MTDASAFPRLKVEPLACERRLAAARLRRHQARHHRDGYLRPPRRNPPRRAAIVAGSRREPHADPRSAERARAGRLRARRPAPRHLCGAQDEARSDRDDHGLGGDRKPRGALRGRAGERERAAELRELFAQVRGEPVGAYQRVFAGQHGVSQGHHPHGRLRPDERAHRQPVHPYARGARHDHAPGQSRASARSSII